jgi:ferredoxin
MSNYLQALNLSLSAKSDTGKLRQQVLESTPWAPAPTTNVSYVAANRVLIIADLDTAQEIEQKLPEKILCYIAVPSKKSGSAKVANGFNCAGIEINGYLGRFTVLIDQHQDQNTDLDNNLANIFRIQTGVFDQVLSYGKKPLISAEIKPPGYYHIGQDLSELELKLDQALGNIPEMIGEFEKPKYFNYNPDICAHDRSGIGGCTRCLDACPTDAIISIGESIEVNSHLCQGGGVCASSCPTGAISYVYPKAEDQIEFLRVMLKTLRQGNNNCGITLLIFDNEHGRDAVEKISANLNENIIPFVVEEIGSVGMDLLASALAYGANRIVLHVPNSVSSQVTTTLNQNLVVISAVLEQTKCTSHKIEIIEDLEELVGAEETDIVEHAATFASVGNKRSIIRAALSFFAELPGNSAKFAKLPSGSLFGQVHLDVEHCTLCMGCVSVCPAGALLAGGESPALKFVEANCVQCGICTRACPESVIKLESRLHFDYNVVNKMKPLKEEAPFRCIECGKPFATKAMITKMTEKLKDHWMFEKPEAISRLKMCEDCRVKDMFDKGDMIS